MELRAGTYFAGFARPFFVSQAMVRDKFLEFGLSEVQFFPRGQPPPVNPKSDPNYSDDWDEWVRAVYDGPTRDVELPMLHAWLVHVTRPSAEPQRAREVFLFPVDRAARPTPQFSQRFGEAHKGTDIFAAEGTALLAVGDGTIRHDDDPKGGKVIYLTGNDGWRYYYAHLSAYEGAPRKVKAGEVIGYVGRTGNAATREPHLHFEMRPPPTTPGGKAGAPTDPFPFLQGAFPQGAVVPGNGGPSLRTAGGGALAILLLLYWLSRR